MTSYSKRQWRCQDQKNIKNAKLRIALRHSFAWISSYLSDSRISVVTNRASSFLYPINVGIPPRSVLASTIFILNINSLLVSTSTPIHSYIDNNCLYASSNYHKHTPNLHRTINVEQSVFILKNLGAIPDWEAENSV